MTTDSDAAKDDNIGEAKMTAALQPREFERKPYSEKRLGQESLAVWEFDDLPPAATLTHVTLLPYRGERAVVAWRDGAMALPEGDVAAGETAARAIARIAADQVGTLQATATHLGHFRYRATSASKTLAPGTITYQAVYGVEAGDLADFPRDPAFERRLVTQRELNPLVRRSHLEFVHEYADALDIYLLARLTAKLPE